MEIKKKPRRVGTRERDEDGLEGLGVHQGAQQVGVVLRRGVEYQARVQGLDWVHMARTVAERLLESPALASHQASSVLPAVM
jgi:hypothetical protein